MAEVSAQAIKNFMEQCSVVRPITISFTEPMVSTPTHSLDRNKPSEAAYTVNTETLVAFLQSFCEEHEKKYKGPHPKVAYDAMRKHFSNFTQNDDTLRPILMSEMAITDWLEARYAPRKTSNLEIPTTVGAVAKAVKIFKASATRTSKAPPPSVVPTAAAEAASAAKVLTTSATKALKAPSRSLTLAAAAAAVNAAKAFSGSATKAPEMPPSFYLRQLQ